MSTSLTELSQLATLINDSIATIQSTCTSKGLEFPDINGPFTPASESFRYDPSISEAVSVAAAAAFQITAVLESPFSTIGHIFGGPYRAATINSLITTNVPEILREAGSQGLHVNDIGKRNGQDPKKLARLLRFAASYHIFKEVSPDVFAHNRVSSVLDSGKGVEAILKNPQAKHDGTPGFSALVEHVLDDGGNSAMSLPALLADPKLRMSEEPTETPFNLAFKTKLNLFEWFDEPEQDYRRRRFGVAMQGVAGMFPPDAVLNGFDWHGLPAGSTIVDVGAGVGTVSLALAKALPKVNIIVQDRPFVVEQAQDIWAKELPDAVKDGRVKLQAHDFFTAQPVKKPTIFLVKQVVHDWSDKYSRMILKNLRDAAGPDTKLVMVESLVSHACPDPNIDSKDGVPGAAARQAPRPIIPNFGPANDMHFNGDFTVWCTVNGQERTFKHLEQLCKEAGWKCVKVYRSEGGSSFMQQIEAVPI